MDGFIIDGFEIKLMNRLIYAASETDADMLYATRFLAPDPFLYFEKAGKRFVALSQLEYDRGRRDAQVDEVINQSAVVKGLRRGRAGPVKTADWIFDLLERRGLRTIAVSPSFPVSLADALRRRRLKVVVAEQGLFPERFFKAPDELRAIRRALRVTARLLELGIEMIRSARVGRKGVLRRGGAALTSERIHAAIRMEAARLGFEAVHPIVAGGVQACDPHERGHGPLRARECIILDIFPRDLKTGYWGDMTRTVVKGRASEAQRRLFQIVHQGQRLAVSKLRDGVDGRSVHEAVDGFFKKQGYVTGNESGRCQGFFHGTGHGLGLEIHEPPRVSSVSQRLREGHVVTVEPGLYYPRVGGVRIEDVVALHKGGCERLSHFPVRLEI